MCSCEVYRSGLCDTDKQVALAYYECVTVLGKVHAADSCCGGHSLLGDSVVGVGSGSVIAGVPETSGRLCGGLSGGCGVSGDENEPGSDGAFPRDRRAGYRGGGDEFERCSGNGSDRAGAGVSLGIRGPVTLPRGPNFLRNYESRLRKKIAKEEKKSGKVQLGFFSGCESVVQDRLRETRAKLLIAENERKLVEEERKLKYLNSPMAAVAEAMKAMAVVEKIAKKESDSKVLGWARTVSQGYASSFSGTSEKDSATTVSVGSSVTKQSKLAKVYGFVEYRASEAEKAVLACGLMSSDQIVAARIRVKRGLTTEDFLRPDFPYKIDRTLKYELENLGY